MSHHDPGPPESVLGRAVLLLDAFHKGMRFAHVPVTFRERTTGRSFVSLAYPFKALPQIAMVLVGVRPMKLFAPIGLSFMVETA